MPMQCLHVILAGGKMRAVSRNCYESRGVSTARLIEAAAEGLPLRPAEFLVNTGDQPGPIGKYTTFSFSTVNDDYRHVCPDFLFDAWPEVRIDDYTQLCQEMALAGEAPPADPRVGWIGVPMVAARERLVQLGRTLPAIIEAIDMRWDRANPSRLTSNRYLSLPDQVRRWKYLIDVEGCGWSARLKTLLWSGRVTFIADRPWKEWFFPLLEPWKHYVPVRRDLSDLADAVQRLEADPALQDSIARDGQQFARQHLTRAAAIARWRELLIEHCGSDRPKPPVAQPAQPRSIPTPAPAAVASPRPIPAPVIAVNAKEIPAAAATPAPVRRIVVIPAGRRRYLEILLPYLERQKDAFDELRLWLNTTNVEDLAYCANLAERFSWIKTVASKVPVNGILSICHFFTDCAHPQEHYLRLDDDVVYLEPGYIARTFAFRAAHPEYFLVFGNIINNAILAHLHQRFGHLRVDQPLGYVCMDDVGWKDGLFAEGLHREFLRSVETGEVKRWHFDRWVLDRAEHVSINSICWRGIDFTPFQGRVGLAEEIWLTVEYPRAARKTSVIYGGAVCAHFAFGPQREHLDQTDLLARYAALAGLPTPEPAALACSPS